MNPLGHHAARPIASDRAANPLANADAIRRAARAHADRVEIFAICAIAFSLGFFNGRPFRLSAGFFVVASLGLLYLNGLLRGRSRVRIPQGAGVVVAAWLAWLVVATLSMLAHATVGTLWAWAWIYVVPAMMLLSLIGVSITERQALAVIAAFAAGLLLRFGYGALVFYQTWGAPSLESVLMAHFDLVKIGPYSAATFGSTSSSAGLIAPAIVLLTLTIVRCNPRPLMLVLLCAAIAVLGVNALITGSRGLMLVSALVFLMAGARLRARWGVPLVVVLVALTYIFTSSLGAGTLGRFSAAATSNSSVDSSVRERLLSIEIGLDTMLANPLGVGPGKSHQFNRFSTAHQFAVNQGAELGPLGFVTTLMLAVAIGWRTVARRYELGRPSEFVFRFAALTWMLFAMIVNMPLGNGPTMVWAGVLALLVALSEMTPSRANTMAARPHGRLQ